MDRNEVRRLARRIVEDVSPEQAEVFDLVADLYLDDPELARVDDSGRGPLSGGFAEVMAAAVPIAVYVADHVAAAVLDVSIEQTVKTGARHVRQRLRPVDPHNPGQVREAAVAAARRCGVPMELAGQIADVVVREVTGAAAPRPRSAGDDIHGDVEADGAE